jgi:hypothetical protein
VLVWGNGASEPKLPIGWSYLLPEGGSRRRSRLRTWEGGGRWVGWLTLPWLMICWGRLDVVDVVW